MSLESYPLSQKAIKEYKDIHLRVYGEKVDIETAREQAKNLLRLTYLITQKEDVSEKAKKSILHKTK